MEEMLSVGECRVCGREPLGLRVCGSCSHVVLLCDECDAAYQTLEQAAKATFALDGVLPCPYCEASLWQAPARWASEEDFDREPWLSAAIESGDAVPQRSKPFGRSAFGEAD